jgi:hypothetical protein
MEDVKHLKKYFMVLVKKTGGHFSEHMKLENENYDRDVHFDRTVDLPWSL